jgi:hypothetical protein
MNRKSIKNRDEAMGKPRGKLQDPSIAETMTHVDTE